MTSDPLVAEGNLAPLLDGLDEVDAPYREACVAAVNAYLDEHFAAIVKAGLLLTQSADAN